MSSNILGAYKKFKSIEKKAELDKKKRVLEESRQKQDVEITDATNFLSRAGSVQALSVGTGPVFKMIGSMKQLDCIP